ncbi:MAG TPA: antibiotic biosynthesis monooxygenase [Burkholderiales bacterium]|jgi:heme-degrading monooxygenase HmoA|nr:antibiotic biosynthesis monooxygenase [Burkholderiales bacterium]
MILEVAVLDVISGREVEFEAAFRRAQAIMSSMHGYRSHELHRCIETTTRYILLVRWDKLEDHTVGFRGSPGYQEWKRQLHHFYDPFPVVEHFTLVHSVP